MYKIVILFLSMLFLFACNTENKSSEYPQTVFFKVVFSQKKDSTTINQPDTAQVVRPKTITEAKEYTEKYICPMHCTGSGSVKEGNCNNCGMELIENLDKK